MAKKFVRGITDIKTISKQDFDTNNVNDLLSDGEHNYIHRKKQDKSEEYHNLTDNIKTISSDNTDLLSVTNNNKTTNTATLHPKHDVQKEQVLESTRNTIDITHAQNGTTERTKVDTNPEKVLEHSNLLTDYGISKTTSGNTTKLGIEYTKVNDGFDLNDLKNGRVVCSNFANSPKRNTWFFIAAYNHGSVTIQEAVKLFENNVKYIRTRTDNVWSGWREQVGDKSVIDGLLAQKQNNLLSSDSIGVLSNNKLTQLVNFKNTYYVANGFLKTHIRSIAETSAVNTPLQELYLNIKIKQGVKSITFTLNERDTNAFFRLLQAYNTNNTAKLNGYIFTLSGSSLTITPPSTDYDQGMTFSDIIS